jgi:AcrR family transcriptional regulator
MLKSQTSGWTRKASRDVMQPTRTIRTRDTITRAFVELMCRDGYASVTIPRVAKAAGISRSTIYLHYRGKQALLTESLDHPCRLLVSCAVGTINIAELENMLEHFKAQSTLNRVFFWEPVRTLWVRKLASLYARRIERSGRIRTQGIPCDLLAYSLSEMQIGLIARWLLRSGSGSIHSVALALIRQSQALYGAEDSLSQRTTRLHVDRIPEVSMSNLSVSDIRPFIPAKSFEQSKQFYSRIGWTVKDVAPKLALVEAQDVHFYIQDYYLKDVAENAMLHITVEDASAWYQHVARVLEKGGFQRHACRSRSHSLTERS